MKDLFRTTVILSICLSSYLSQEKVLASYTYDDSHWEPTFIEIPHNSILALIEKDERTLEEQLLDNIIPDVAVRTEPVRPLKENNNASAPTKLPVPLLTTQNQGSLGTLHEDLIAPIYVDDETVFPFDLPEISLVPEASPKLGRVLSDMSNTPPRTLRKRDRQGLFTK